MASDNGSRNGSGVREFLQKWYLKHLKDQNRSIMLTLGEQISIRLKGPWGKMGTSSCSCTCWKEVHSKPVLLLLYPSKAVGRYQSAALKILGNSTMSCLWLVYCRWQRLIMVMFLRPGHLTDCQVQVQMKALYKLSFMGCVVPSIHTLPSS